LSCSPYYIFIFRMNENYIRNRIKILICILRHSFEQNIVVEETCEFCVFIHIIYITYFCCMPNQIYWETNHSEIRVGINISVNAFGELMSKLDFLINYTHLENQEKNTSEDEVSTNLFSWIYLFCHHFRSPFFFFLIFTHHEQRFAYYYTSWCGKSNKHVFFYVILWRMKIIRKVNFEWQYLCKLYAQHVCTNQQNITSVFSLFKSIFIYIVVDRLVLCSKQRTSRGE
jgi:hypothetical protein